MDYKLFNAELTCTSVVYMAKNKVLGRGAMVKLLFRIPDFHRVAIKTICKRTNRTISSKVSRYNG